MLLSEENYKTSKIYANVLINDNVKALCINNIDPYTNKTEKDLIIGREYEVEYALIGRSYVRVSLVDIPTKDFNAQLFKFFVNREPFDLIDDYYKIQNYLGNIELRFNNFFFYKETDSERIEEIKSKYFKFSIINHPSWYAFIDRIKISRELQRLLDIEEEVNNKVDEILKNKSEGMSVFLRNARYRLFWEEKKKILKEEYGIDWLTPIERKKHY